MNTTAAFDIWNTILAWLGTWGSRIVGAAIILAVAYGIARAAKWALATALDRVPALKPAEGATGPSTGARLGDAAFWLVILFALPPALGALQMQSIVEPLSAMIAKILAFLPDLLGAGILFAIGLLVASIAERAVTATLAAANADGWVAKLKLGEGSGVSVSGATGKIVYAIVIIPVAIAALQALRVEAISRPAIEVLSSVFDVIPRVVAASIVLAIAIGIGRFLSGLASDALPSLGVDNSLSALGLGGADSIKPSKVIAVGISVAIGLFGAIEAAKILQFGAMSAMLAAILELLAKVAFGGVVILAGAWIAGIIAGAASKAGTPGAGFASTLIRGGIIALSAAMGLTYMGIAPDIIKLAFGLILGAAAVAAALAFGLGARDAAGKVANEWADKSGK